MKRECDSAYALDSIDLKQYETTGNSHNRPISTHLHMNGPMHIFFHIYCIFLSTKPSIDCSVQKVTLLLKYIFKKLYYY